MAGSAYFVIQKGFENSDKCLTTIEVVIVSIILIITCAFIFYALKFIDNNSKFYTKMININKKIRVKKVVWFIHRPFVQYKVQIKILFWWKTVTYFTNLKDLQEAGFDYKNNF